MTLKHMTILVEAFCATYQIDEHLKEIFSQYVMTTGGCGITKAFTNIYTVIEENCPTYDGSDEQNEWLMSLLRDHPEITSGEKALRILAGRPLHSSQPYTAV